MKIISFLNSKGGVGKSTLCTNLAAFLQTYKCTDEQFEPCTSVDDEPLKVLVVDADPQGSVRDWFEAGGDAFGFEMIAADRKQTLLQLPEVLKNSSYDFVLIDTPGKVSDLMAAAIAISDICLLPVQPSPYDLWAIQDVIELLKTRQTIANDKPSAYFVLNLCRPNTRLGRDVVEHLSTCTFATLGRPISKRESYKTSAVTGGTVFDTDDASAKAEITSLGLATINALFHAFEEAPHDL